LQLKNKTNQLFLPFIYCRLGINIIEKEKKEKAREKSKGKTKKKSIKKTLQTYIV
jgi:hypothetical protein